MCPLDGRVNYSFVSTDEEGKWLAAKTLFAAVEGASAKSQVELELVLREAELAGVDAEQLEVWPLPLTSGSYSKTILPRARTCTT